MNEAKFQGKEDFLKKKKSPSLREKKGKNPVSMRYFKWEFQVEDKDKEYSHEERKNVYQWMKNCKENIREMNIDEK